MYLSSRNYLGPSRLVQELTVGCYIGWFYDPDKATSHPGCVPSYIGKYGLIIEMLILLKKNPALFGVIMFNQKSCSLRVNTFWMPGFNKRSIHYFLSVVLLHYLHRGLSRIHLVIFVLLAPKRKYYILVHFWLSTAHNFMAAADSAVVLMGLNVQWD